MILRRLVFALLAAIPALLTASCGPGALSAKEGAERKILLVNNSSDPRFLDLHLMNSVPEHHLMVALFEGLVAEHLDDDSQAEPGVAERWEPNEDKSRWTFYLRDNAKWSDGAPITAEDFVWSWRRILTRKLGAEYAQMLFALKNGREFYKGTAKAEDLGVKAVNPRVLEVELVGPTPHFPLMLQHCSWWPVPRHVIEKHGDPFDPGNRWWQPENLVSNGPFKLKDYRFRQVLEVERNPHYWDAANVKLNGIRFFPIDSDQTEERLFRRGRLHIGYTLPPSRIEYFQKNHPDLFKREVAASTEFYRFNTTRAPFTDKRVRQALSLAIDRKMLVEGVTRGGQIPATGIVPPMTGYTPPPGVAFNPAEAKRLLAEAGFPDGRGWPEGLNILVSASELAARVAEAIQSMWRTHLGIHVGILQQEFTVYLSSQQAMDYDVCRAGWMADFFDPVTFIDMWMTGNGNNNTGWSNAEFDALVNEAARTGDPAKRMEILRRAEALMLEEAPIAPLFYRSHNYLTHNAVTGYFPKLLDNHPWKHVDLIFPPPPSSMDNEWYR